MSRLLASCEKSGKLATFPSNHVWQPLTGAEEQLLAPLDVTYSLQFATVST